MIRARLSRSQAAKARRKLGCPRRSAATAGLGWRPTVTWVGGFGSALAVIALFWVPQSAPRVLWVPLLLAGIYGITLAGFIPLTAMMTSMVPLREKGDAMAACSLAAGLCVFIGPVTYSLLGPTIGYAGVVLVAAGLYLFGAAITRLFLRTDQDPGDRRPTATAVRRREAISA